ncbi:MAG: alpha/beta fold hydrolase, partial [Polyangiaceae bacterium]|nr:alpha/beta fold hydrolase [Polyangiaceae bacterium]
MSALVLLHGFTGAPESFDAVRAHLPSGIVVHAPACLGHADARDVSVASFEDEVDRLASSIAAVTTPPRVLAGYSMGGRLALGLLARHSGLFEHAVIVSAHPGLEDASAREARRRDDAR